MRIAILSQSPNLYSTKRLIRAIKNRGHKHCVINPYRCQINVGAVSSLTYAEKDLSANVDLVITRIGASATQYGLAVSEQLESLGIPTVNASHAIAASRDKLRSLQILARNGVAIPKTVMVRRQDKLKDAIRQIKCPAVLKLIQGTHGLGVMIAESTQSAESMVETVWSLGKNILIQEYVASSRDNEVRAFVIGNEVVAAYSRRSKRGEFRANLHRGGTASALTLSDEDAQLAVNAAKALGLAVAGVDLIRSSSGYKVLEVNSSPGLQGVERVVKADVAGLMISHAVKVAKEAAHG